MRKIDKLGRIVIPRALRKKYGLDEGVGIEFSDDGDGIIIRADEHFCRLCLTEIPDGAHLPLCESCIERAASEYNTKH